MSGQIICGTTLLQTHIFQPHEKSSYAIFRKTKELTKITINYGRKVVPLILWSWIWNMDIQLTNVVSVQYRRSPASHAKTLH